jgi:hypothetical protein
MNPLLNAWDSFTASLSVLGMCFCWSLSSSARSTVTVLLLAFAWSRAAEQVGARMLRMWCGAPNPACGLPFSGTNDLLITQQKLTNVGLRVCQPTFLIMMQAVLWCWVVISLASKSLILTQGLLTAWLAYCNNLVS